MERERERLVKFAFLELRRRCLERRIEFLVVDLRWGISDEQHADLLPICFHEIDLCRPYFVGVLGDRYGSVLPSLPASLTAAQPWLAEYGHASVTELEICYGALNAPSAATRSFFYFRTPAQDDGGSVDPYLSQLRAEVRASGLPLRENYPDADTLADWVIDDLWGAITSDFPDDVPPDEWGRIAGDHDSFGESLRGNFLLRAGLLEQLDAHANGDGPPIAVVGDVGSGKTALLANWSAHYRAAHADALVMVHFVGCTPESTQLTGLLERIGAEVARRFDLPSPASEDGRHVRDELPQWLCEAAKRARMVLVIDGVDQFESGDGTDLAWLPHDLPPGVRLIVSSRSCPAAAVSPTQRAIAQRGWPTLELRPLKPAEIGEIATRFLRRYGKTLTTAQVASIVDREKTANPLFLSVLLEDLRVFGSHEQLERQLARYLAAPDAERLYELVLERLDGDFAEGGRGLVSLALGLIWASRDGLSEGEIEFLLAQGRGDTSGKAIRPAEWAVLRYGLGNSLVSRSGLLGFARDELRRAVETRFLADPSRRRSLHVMLGNFFTIVLFRHTLPDQAKEFPQLDAWLQRVFTEQPETMTRDERALAELPWQWLQVEDWSKLRAVLAHPRMVGALYDHQTRRRIARYWDAVTGRFDVVAEYEKLLDDAQTATDPKTFGLACGAVGELLRDAGHYEAAERWLMKGIRSLASCEPPVEPLELWTSLGNLYEELNRHDQAREWHERALIGVEKYFGTERPEFATALNALAMDHQHLDELDQAARLLERGIAIMERRYGVGTFMIAEFLANLGGVRIDQGRYTEAEGLYNRALPLLERRLGNVHPALASVTQGLGDVNLERGNYIRALEYFRQSEHLIEQTLGRDNRLYAAALVKQARASEGFEAYEQTIALFQKALGIRRSLYAPDADVVIDCVVGIADARMARGEFDLARMEMQQALDELTALPDACERSLRRLRERLVQIANILG